MRWILSQQGADNTLKLAFKSQNRISALQLAAIQQHIGSLPQSGAPAAVRGGVRQRQRLADGLEALDVRRAGGVQAAEDLAGCWPLPLLDQRGQDNLPDAFGILAGLLSSFLHS